MTTASVVIIGDEILTGKFADENGPYLISRFRAMGVELVRLAIVRDVLEEIAAEVRRASADSDVVITTGGVGPTHDDITFEAVALAFDVPLVVEPRLVALIERYGLTKDEAMLRMATVPEGTVLEDGEDMAYPVVRVRNVYVFPGVPKLLRRKFEQIASQWMGDPVRCVRIYASDEETSIALRLTALDEAHPGVVIGSYPRFDEEVRRLIVTVEGRDERLIDEAVAAIGELLQVIEVVA